MTMREDYEKWIKDEDAVSLWSLYKSAYIAGQKDMRELAHKVSERASMAGSNAAYLIMKEIRALPIEGEES